MMTSPVRTLCVVAGSLLVLATAASAVPPAEHAAPAGHAPPAATPGSKSAGLKPKQTIASPRVPETRYSPAPAAVPSVRGEAPRHAARPSTPSNGPAPDSASVQPAPPHGASMSDVHDVTSAASPMLAAAEQSLTMLRQGNERWVKNSRTSPNTELTRMEATAQDGQTPFCSIITCSDSRIPVERVFDSGVGDLFVVRVAGNRAGGSETGTIEYGVGHLKTPLLVVMGHTRCGAVAAAIANTPLHGKVGELVDGIKPAVERARRTHPQLGEQELNSLVTRENVWQTIFDLYKSSPEILAQVGAKKVKVVGAVYDIATGKVEFMGEHPWQTELIAAMAEPSKAKGVANQGVAGQGVASVQEHK